MESQFPPPKTFWISGYLQAFQKMGRTPQTIIPLFLSLFVILFIDSCKKDSSIVNPSPAFSINSVKPLIGKQGDTIIITGTNFNLNPAMDTVKFNGVTAHVQKATTDTLYVITPPGNCSGVITVNGITAPGLGFTVTPTGLSIKTVNPQSGKQGDTIIITGNHFNTDPALDTVKFNGIPAQVIKAKTDTLFAIVPKGSSSGTVTVNGTSAPGPVFTVFQIGITAVKPVWGKQGDTILIIGAYFNLNPLEDTVMINGVTARVLIASADTLYVIVPLTSTGTVTVNGAFAPPPGFIYGPPVIVTTITGGMPIVYGSSGDGPDSLATFDQPTGLCFDKLGNLFISEWGGNGSAIREISAGYVSSIVNAPSGGADGIALDAQGNIYTTDGGFAENLSGNEGYHSPVAAMSVQKISNGVVSYLFYGFYNGAGMAFDSQGNLYVAESGAIQKITPSGQLSTFAGKGAQMGIVWLDSPYRYHNQWILNNGEQDGQDTSARFGDVVSLALDAGDNIYAVDMGCACIRKVTPSGLVSTISFSGSSYWWVPPPPSAVIPPIPYGGPLGICVDASGNIYATEGNSIVKITPAGVVSTIAGSNTPGFADGPAAIAQFNNPNALALDASGNLYVSDAGNQRIRKITFQ